MILILFYIWNIVWFHFHLNLAIDFFIKWNFLGKDNKNKSAFVSVISRQWLNVCISQTLGCECSSTVVFAHDPGAPVERQTDPVSRAGGRGLGALSPAPQKVHWKPLYPSPHSIVNLVSFVFFFKDHYLNLLSFITSSCWLSNPENIITSYRDNREPQGCGRLSI